MNASGLILVVFIGLIVAWVATRGGKKMNLSVKGKHWVIIAIVVALGLILIYGATHTPHTPTR